MYQLLVYMSRFLVFSCLVVDEKADKGWMMIRIGEWVNVSSGTGSPG